MSSNISLGFGIGALIATPQNGSPVQFGTLQEVNIEFSASVKTLMGQFKFPVAAAGGPFKVSWKAKSAQIIANQFNLIFGLSSAVGQKLWAYNEAHSTGVANSTTFTGSIPAGSTALTSSSGPPVIGEQITGTNVLPGTFIVSGSGTAWVVNQAPTLAVTAATLTMAGEGFATTNNTTADTDLGVSYALTGVQLVRVYGAAPTVGQYLYGGGVYSFAAADASKSMFATYSYTQAVTGTTTVIANQLLGTSAPFQVDFLENNPASANTQWSLRLYNSIATKLSIGTKNEDWTVPDLEGECFCNSAGNLGEYNLAQ